METFIVFGEEVEGTRQAISYRDGGFTLGEKIQVISGVLLNDGSKTLSCRAVEGGDEFTVHPAVFNKRAYRSEKDTAKVRINENPIGRQLRITSDPLHGKVVVVSKVISCWTDEYQSVDGKSVKTGGKVPAESYYWDFDEPQPKAEPKPKRGK